MSLHLTQGLQLRDWLVMGFVTAAWIVSTVFLCMHPTGTNFATWSALAATMTGAYHWLVLLDTKRPDAPCGD